MAERANFAFPFSARATAKIVAGLIASKPTPHPLPPVDLTGLPFDDHQDTVRFCRLVMMEFSLHVSVMPTLIAAIESCYDYLQPATARMIILASALYVCKLIDDRSVSVDDKDGELPTLGITKTQLLGAELLVAALLLQIKFKTGQPIMPSLTPPRPLVRSYLNYAGYCFWLVDDAAETHIAAAWWRLIARRNVSRRRTARLREHEQRVAAAIKL